LSASSPLTTVAGSTARSSPSLVAPASREDDPVRKITTIGLMKKHHVHFFDMTYANGEKNRSCYSAE
jgi:hypothetical protein